jgi:glycerol-3-phosphate responsive antiterminator
MIRLLADGENPDDGAPFIIPASALASYEAASQEARALADRFAEALPGRMTEIAEQLTAQLPPEVRAAGIHLAYDTTPTTEA